MKKIYLYIAIFLISFTSCNDYLDVEPKGQLIPTTIGDYDLLLTPIHTMGIEELGGFSGDDFTIETGSLGDLVDPDNLVTQLYKFQGRFNNPSIPCDIWNDLYANIYVTNKVINGIDKADEVVGYTNKDRNIIKAEAKYFRAVQYFYLVNFFGKHYSSENRSTVAIPLVTTANVSQESPTFATVEDIYKLIEEDLLFAVNYLPKKGKLKTRPSKGAGYAFLSRMYLYQGNYDKALKNAELALREKNFLSDYANFVTNNYLEWGKLMDKEQYTVAKFGYTVGFAYGNLSSEVVELYEEKDSRLQKWFSGCQYVIENGRYVIKDGKYVMDCTKKGNSYSFEPNTLPSVGEMYITAAECCARLNKPSEALVKLNTLRANRVPGVPAKTTADYSSEKDLLKFLLEERRREMVWSGLRLFEIKRLNLEPEFQKTVVHKIKTDNGEQEYKAEPNSGKLVFPIPANVKKFNKNIK